MSRKARVWLAGLVLLAVGGCDGGTTGPDASLKYTVRVGNETFVVRVAADEQAAELDARLATGDPGVITGSLVSGDGGFNQPWGWHLDPATVHAVDIAMELCDGRPSDVQASLQYWIGTVRQFCPWAAKVVRRAP